MTAELQVLVVDDEPLARMRLKTLLAQASCANTVVAEFGEAGQALSWLQARDREGALPDLVLLDIQMPGLDGLGLATQLGRLSQMPCIAFVTAHAEHALQAFDLNALDYLTKPVRLERLNATLERVVKRAAPGQAGHASAPVILVQDRGRTVRVLLSEVVYFKAELKYVTLRTADQSHVLDESLTELESRVGERFIRVHRNALVAKDAIKALDRRIDDDEGGETWAVQVMPTREWLAVSRRQVAAVREAIAAG